MQFRRLIAAALILAPTAATAAGEVNVYSYRQPFLVKPLFDAFTKQSGTKVNVVFARKGLIKRLQAEGRNSSADLIFTTDIGRLAAVVNAGLAQPVKTAALDKAVPEVGLTTFRPPFTPVTFGTLVNTHRGELFDVTRTAPMDGWAAAQGAEAD